MQKKLLEIETDFHETLEGRSAGEYLQHYPGDMGDLLNLQGQPAMQSVENSDYQQLSMNVTNSP